MMAGKKSLASRCSFVYKWVPQHRSHPSFHPWSRLSALMKELTMGICGWGIPGPLSSLSSPDSSHMLSNGKRQILSQTTQLQSIQPPLQDEKLCRNGLRLQFYSCRLVQQSQRHFTAGQLSFVCLSGFKIFF